MAHHIVEMKTNITTLLILVCLTIITVLTAKLVDIGDYNLLLAMFIATIKATVVFGWFMHLRYEDSLTCFHRHDS